MFIKLGDGYELHRKPYNYELKVTKKRDDPDRDNFGTDYTKSLGYASDVEGLIKAMVEHNMRTNEIETLRSLCAYQKRLMSKLDRRLNVAVADLITENQELEGMIKVLQKKINKLERSEPNEGAEDL